MKNKKLGIIGARQVEIAKRSLKTNPVMAELMGMSHDEAQKILKKFGKGK